MLHNHINFDGSVDVDRGYHVHLASAEDYEKTVDPATWSLAQYFAQDLREREVKVAFFSMTCQGKPDVPTRHALSRFTESVGVHVKWYDSYILEPVSCDSYIVLTGLCRSHVQE